MESNFKLPRVILYSLEFNIEPAEESFSSSGKITFTNETNQVFKEIPFSLYHELKVTSIKDDMGNELTYKQMVVPFEEEEKYKVNYILIKLNEDLLQNQSYTIDFEYEGSLNGYSEFRRYVKDSINSKFSIIREDCCAYPLLTYPKEEYYKNILYSKFEYKLDVVVPNKYTVGCGGILKGITSVGNKKRFTYISSIPTWRLDITVSRYEIIEDKEMNLKIFTFPKDKNFAETRLKEEIKRAYNYFLSAFGDYPIGSHYTVIEIPETYGSQAGDGYIMMEEHGFGENSMLTHLYHEIGHAWNVNAKPDVQGTRFFDEAFACYYEALAIREFYGQAHYEERMEKYRKRYMQCFENNKLCYDVPIAKYSENELGYCSYTKGPWVLYVLHKIVGEENFFKIIVKLLNDFKGNEVEFEDFKKVAEEVSLMNLERFFEEWIYGIESSRYLCEGIDVLGIIESDIC